MIPKCPNGHYYDPTKTEKCPRCASLTEWGNRTPAANAETSGETIVIPGFNPVVGWLICTEGTEKGEDYRIRFGKNSIGRSKEMAICLSGDDTVSRNNHAFISYDDRNKIYFFSPCENKNLVRVNGKPIFATVELAAYDEIELGSSKFIFLPLCGEAFDWQK